MRLQLYICEDSLDFIQSLERYLPRLGEVEIVGVAQSAEQALADSALWRAEVLLLDIEMPGKGGLWAIDPIVAHEPHPEILMLTTHASEEKVFLAIKSGAAGYLVKGSSFQKILQGLEDIHTGGTVIDPTLAMRFWRLFTASVGRWEQVPWSLTAGELEVLSLVAKGLSNPEVGSALGKSRANIKKHLARIYTKLSVNSRVDAVTLALKAGIITLE